MLQLFQMFLTCIFPDHVIKKKTFYKKIRNNQEKAHEKIQKMVQKKVQ